MLTISGIPFKTTNNATDTNIHKVDDDNLIVIAKNNLNVVRMEAVRTSQSEFQVVGDPVFLIGTSVSTAYVRSIERKRSDGSGFIMFAKLYYGINNYYLEQITIYVIDKTTGQLTSGVLNLGQSVNNNLLSGYDLDYCPVSQRIILSWTKRSSTSYDKWSYFVTFDYIDGQITGNTVHSLGYWYTNSSTLVTFAKILAKGDGKFITAIDPYAAQPAMPTGDVSIRGIPGGVHIIPNGSGGYTRDNPLEASYSLVDTDGVTFLNGSMVYISGGSNRLNYSTQMYSSTTFNGVTSPIPQNTSVNNHLVQIEGNKYFGFRKTTGTGVANINGALFKNNTLSELALIHSFAYADTPEAYALTSDLITIGDTVYAKALARYDGSTMLSPLTLLPLGATEAARLSRVAGWIAGG